MDLQGVGFERGGWSEDSFDLVYDSVKWRAVANTVMNFWVPSNTGNFLTNEEFKVSPEVFCSMESVS